VGASEPITFSVLSSVDRLLCYRRNAPRNIHMTIIGDAGPHRAGDAGAPRGPGTNHLFANSARSPTEGLTVKAANWIILAALLGMLLATIWIGYDMWTTTSDIPVSENGYIAMVLVGHYHY
jgi:hypothetical protein